MELWDARYVSRHACFTIYSHVSVTGFLASVTIKIIPCKEYVRVEYIPCSTRAESTKVFQEKSLDYSNDFVEGLMYSRDQMVVMPARFADASEVESAKLNPIGRWHKPWFYKHVEKKLKNNETTVEYIPLRHYFHRHTKVGRHIDAP